jgi:hypothetical protein
MASQAVSSSCYADGDAFAGLSHLISFPCTRVQGAKNTGYLCAMSRCGVCAAAAADDDDDDDDD